MPHHGPCPGPADDCSPVTFGRRTWIPSYSLVVTCAWRALEDFPLAKKKPSRLAISIGGFMGQSTRCSWTGCSAQHSSSGLSASRNALNLSIAVAGLEVWQQALSSTLATRDLGGVSSGKW